MLSILLLIGLAIPLTAQRGDVVLCEGFYSPWLNEGWDVGGDDWVVWYISNTANAGNKAHEPESISSAASLTPSCMESALPPIYSAAPALRSVALR